jgi:hypothetical protein
VREKLSARTVESLHKIKSRSHSDDERRQAFEEEEEAPQQSKLNEKVPPRTKQSAPLFTGKLN